MFWRSLIADESLSAERWKIALSQRSPYTNDFDEEEEFWQSTDYSGIPLDPGVKPDTVSFVGQLDIVDSLWGDRYGRRQIQLGKWEQAWQIPTDDDILSDPSSTPYSSEVDEALTPAKKILYDLLCDPEKVDSNLVPAKAWLESKNKDIFKTIIPYTGPLTVVERAQISNWFESEITKDKRLRRYWVSLLPLAHAHTVYIASLILKSQQKVNDSLLDSAWDVQCSPKPLRMFERTDVDLECLSFLEEEMFENSLRAGIAGNYQWGLDVGNHQDDWKPYLCRDWFIGDREVNDDEMLPGPKYIDQPKTKVEVQPKRPRPKPRPIPKKRKLSDYVCGGHFFKLGAEKPTAAETAGIRAIRRDLVSEVRPENLVWSCLLYGDTLSLYDGAFVADDAVPSGAFVSTTVAPGTGVDFGTIPLLRVK
ncbi:hypothetical protein JR316_0013429 [Psilocybe cubensis]|uniref:Uncharacterized protein n=1 Tax=Psilocybe cubensis TaxID=181762 RepID=A0ACB8GGF4_PSICU|nr:uncharacterized protein JR316_0013429 [Psilocybe cubensis]KAH9474266.1 hypothetical protein JR316_0013429 [Psilocybe cubensis]